MRGPGGGYRLGMDSYAISIGTVIAAVDESVDATKCNRKGDCKGGTRCLTYTLWRDLSSRVTDFLNNITLGELMMDNEVLEVSDRQDLHLAVSQRVSLNNSNTVTIGAAPLVLMFAHSGKVYTGVENETAYLSRLFSDMPG